MEMPRYGSFHQVMPLIVAHHLFRLGGFLDVEFSSMIGNAALFQDPHCALFGSEVHKSPRGFVPVNKGDKTPLREEVTNLLLAISVTYAPHEHLARVRIAKHRIFRCLI